MSFPATTQPPSPILVAREGAEQSRGSPKAWHPILPTAGVHGERIGNMLHTPLHSPVLVTHTTVLPARQDRWDMDTGAPPTFWGIARLGRVLIGLGQPLAVQAQPGCLYSHSSVPASLAVPCCSHAPCRTQRCGAKPGLFLHPPNSALNPMGKADSSPRSRWDPCLRARTEAWTWDCQDSCRQVYPQHRVEVGNTG